jgi:DNA-binding transcriptional ArsR family regulator
VASGDVRDPSVLRAFGHPLRLRLLTVITELGEASSAVLSRELDVPLSTVSHHVRILRDLGYLEPTRSEPRRGAVERYYRATAAPFVGDSEWERLPTALRRGIANQLLRQVLFEAYEAGHAEGFETAGAHLTRTMLELDARGWRELSQAVIAFLKRVEALQARSDARGSSRQPGDEPPRRSELALLHFPVDGSAPATDRREPRRGRPPRLP